MWSTAAKRSYWSCTRCGDVSATKPCKSRSVSGTVTSPSIFHDWGTASQAEDAASKPKRLKCTKSSMGSFQSDKLLRALTRRSHRGQRHRSAPWSFSSAQKARMADSIGSRHPRCRPLGRGRDRKRKGSNVTEAQPHSQHRTCDLSWPWQRSTSTERWRRRWSCHASAAKRSSPFRERSSSSKSFRSSYGGRFLVLFRSSCNTSSKKFSTSCASCCSPRCSPIRGLNLQTAS
mmetsp:Transcript_37878/g.107118  ORF Transcript_37878/g.107118 Transcript_37878/m.107118 type:complete len:232 (+) Transcript_37878:390-1085(+)